MLKTNHSCICHCVGLDVGKVRECMGDPEADTENAILTGEQDAQVFFLQIIYNIYIVFL